MDENKPVILRLEVAPHSGYAADQVFDEGVTLGALLEAVQEAIEDYGDGAVVVTHDGSNRYGAAWGTLVLRYDGTPHIEEAETEE